MSLFQNHRFLKAFTLMELLVTILIISALAGTALLQFDKTVNQANSRNAYKNLITIHAGIQSYEAIYGTAPTSTFNSLDEINSQFNLNLTDEYFQYQYTNMGIWQVTAARGNPYNYTWTCVDAPITDNPSSPNPVCSPSNKCP